MNCKLPWTIGRTKELKDCATSEHLMNFQSLSMSLMYLGEPNYYNITKCLNPCTYYHFEAKQVRIYTQSYSYYITLLLHVSLDVSY